MTKYKIFTLSAKKIEFWEIYRKLALSSYFMTKIANFTLSVLITGLTTKLLACVLFLRCVL